MSWPATSMPPDTRPDPGPDIEALAGPVLAALARDWDSLVSALKDHLGRGAS